MPLSAQKMRMLRKLTNDKFNEVKRLRRSLDLLDEKVDDHPRDERLKRKRGGTRIAWKAAGLELKDLQKREQAAWK